VALLTVIGGALLIAALRADLAGSFSKLRLKSDVYVLPDPQQTVVASLGYRSALADLIFGHLLVAQGLHFAERRFFEFVGEYLETVIELDPKFRTPYRYADTLLTLQPVAPPHEFYRKARRLLEKGLEQLPYDQELWSTTGQFLAYLAPPHLPAHEAAEYRLAGARYLARACELIGSNENIPYHCITAASIYDKAGNRTAVRQFLERVLTISDDPTIQAMALAQLQGLFGEEARERASARGEQFLMLWQDDLPGSPRIEVAALGPRFDPAACAGSAGKTAPRPECATNWRDWAERTDSSDTPEVR
jgi:hypothetical protein